ncbi:hypothetical protein [Jiella mangrovi]|uniref:Uncharacterized protein n=1 Tax=Jiella mangrovi TaxID=2821407 RepID=A0ABS4BHK4_9HYPH|nr:hypothetical protein [Jiella mangrovi]MBP0616233.1 hypothetical protein [Jiella mangrovi]
MRRTLTKGNAADPNFRLEIYEAAERALLRLEAANEMSEEARDRHRRELISAVETLETEFAGLDDEAVGASGDASEPRDTRDGPDGFVKTEGGEPVLNGSGEPSHEGAPLSGVSPAAPDRNDAPARAGDEVADTGAAERSGRLGRKLTAAVIVLLLLFLLGVAVWIVLPFFSSASSNDTAEADPNAAGISVADAIKENATSVDQTAAATKWVDVYTPAAMREFADSDSAIELVPGAGGKDALKLEGRTGENTADGSNVTGEIDLPISGDIARQFAGQKVQGEVIVGSPDGTAREFTLRCLFGADTVCGRQRFKTALPEENFLFHLEFPPEAVTGGQIALDPAIGPGAKDLLFFGLKLRQGS